MFIGLDGHSPLLTMAFSTIACDQLFGPVHATSEKFANCLFTLKTHQMFSVHTAPEKFENPTITGNFGYVLEENPGRESHYFRDVIVLEMFSVHTKTQSKRLQIPPV